jgi:HME family heavy-metal exporter
MLNAIIRFALRNRLLIVFVSLATFVYGGYAAATLPIDVFPDLDRPRVVIMTECAGLAPEEVEVLVTFPLESALLGASGVRDVRSQSALGLSVIYVEFDWETDIQVARQVVTERLAALPEPLPAGVRPQLAPVSSIMGQVMLIGLHHQSGPNGGLLAPLGKTGYLVELLSSSEAASPTLAVWDPRDRTDPTNWPPVTGWAVIRGPTIAPRAENDTEWHATIALHGKHHEVVFPDLEQRQMALRTLADWVIRPRLLKIAGIAQVAAIGGGRKQYQVLVDPTALHAHDVSLREVETALKENNINASGGFAERGDREQAVRLLGRLGPEPEQVLADLRRMPVKPTARRTVPLSQVARVVEGPQLKRGDASVNGHPGVVLMVTKQPHIDTRALTEEITAALAEVQGSLPTDLVINPELFQMKGFIDRGIFNVAEALAIGAVLVLLVLFLFLLNFRTTFISLTAIPLSLAITALVFKGIGWLTATKLSINVMTLGGISVAMGELVDDAIVDVENIFRRLRENHALPNPRPTLRVVYEASVEVRSAIVFSTLMVILVFIPLFALGGMEGRLFTPLAWAYIVSILASLLVSLTVTPVLSSYLLPRARATHRREDSPLLRFLKWANSHLILLSMARTRMLLLFTGVLFAGAVVLLSRLGTDFLPAFDEGSVQVNLTLPPGASLAASNRVCAVADARFRQMRQRGEILQFERRTGRAELDEHVEPVSNTEYILVINPHLGRSRDAMLQQILKELKDELPGVDIEAEQPLAHLISHMISGVTAQIAIKVYGDDLDALRSVAEQVKAAVASVEGVTPPVIEAQRRTEELHIRLRPEDLEFYGVDRAWVADFVQAALQGEVVSQVVEGQRRFDLVVRLDEPYRSDHANLGRLQLELPDHRGAITLSDVADIGEGYGANLINRENARRRIVIRCNARGRDLGGVVADIKQRVKQEVALPEGYFIEYGGQFESQSRARWRIGVMVLVAVAGMFVVLYLLFPSARIVLQVLLLALPTAFIGGAVALALTGQTLTVAAWVGFISLGGIAARNGILLVSHYLHLMRSEGESFTQEMILRGSLERLAPVLMTALTASISLVPLVLGGRQPGREILYPVATVILGGLVTSTFCEFLLHPGVFWRFSGRDAGRLALGTRTENELASE